MTPRLEYGEMVISTAENDYLFRPSLDAMTRIGEPKEIVSAFTQLNGAEVQQIIASAVDAYGVVPEWLIALLNKPVYGRSILSTAMDVMQACCNDDCSEVIGEWRVGKSGMVYRRGAMHYRDIILLARELMTHGIIGKAKVRKLQRNEGKDEYSDEFHAVDYISAARVHFNITRSEAEQLTMTEFVMMLKAKYPDEKGFTKDEYEAITKADDVRNDDLIKGKRRLVSRRKV
ncbi:hypothetical protein JC794_08990 [Morganella morganii]|uniref:DUF6246 family protein n=1 Tax=Morganella morganii TaxID=582 RepID=UPI000EBE5D7A|nr:DUF6246 family protein [Morganella morganii]QXO59397.1 hypothetical protein JC827_08985 [Morganella morganii]QXO78366.1 hypothetical protein JC794_08990 [Morganella morganii]HAE77930.1 hypothetical protein [Morganella sp. (in: enterobacteria)]